MRIVKLLAHKGKLENESKLINLIEEITVKVSLLKKENDQLKSKVEDLKNEVKNQPTQKALLIKKNLIL